MRMLFLIIIILIVTFCLYSIIAQKKKKQKAEQIIHEFEKRDKEIELLEKNERIENIGYCIRCVVLCTKDLINEPYPYIIKRDIPHIKEAHIKVLEAYNTNLYEEAVNFAYHDIFDALDIEEYKPFFIEYTQAPTHYNLNVIKKAIPKKYLTDLDDHLFEL